MVKRFAALAAVALLAGCGTVRPAVATTVAALHCSPARAGGAWVLDVTGPGTVRRVAAHGRTVRFPRPVTLGPGEIMSVAWSGTYAASPGRCSAR